MAHVLLFHHAQGLTPGLRAFADDLRDHGHTVTTPDLFGGETFATVDEGVEHARSLGFAKLLEVGVAAADELPQDLVYVGFSMGCMPAQALAQRRAGARGCVLLHGAAPLEEFGGAWPDGVAAQLHIAEDDPWEDLATVRDVAAQIGADLYVYDGDAHLFTDPSVPDHRPKAAQLAFERVRDLLAGLR